MSIKKCLLGIDVILIILTVVSLGLGTHIYRNHAEGTLDRTSLVLIVALSVLFGAGGGYLSFRLFDHLRALENRISYLERQDQKRHTHATAAGLEDALAVLIDVLREYQDSKLYSEARLNQLGEILRSLRLGPHNYDENRPCGRRPIKRYEKK